jgi:AraC-like DNA-binding protein
MDPNEWKDLVPHLNHIAYWERKEKFSYYEDIYREWVIFAVVSGTFFYEFSGQKGTAAFGDLILCPPRVKFRRVVITPLTFFVMRLGWRNDAMDVIFPEEREVFPKGKISIRNTNRLLDNYKLLEMAYRKEKNRRTNTGRHYLKDMWLLHCSELELEREIAEVNNQNRLEPDMIKAALLIQKQALQRVDLKQVAGSLGLSAVRFTQKFKASYGMSPIHYLTSLRIDKAKKLLSETDLTLDQISECIGYQNGYYLNRLFLKHLNTTPGKYRSLHQI